MQRFVYTPRVEAYVALENSYSRPTPTKIIDISDDIISGSITRRVDAMSEASLTLQNKHGRYTRPQSNRSPLGEGGTLIQPMDRIHIRMSRVGEPVAVFSGYVDTSPHYQLYSAPVVIRASCALKRLQNTYFDPGLPSILTLFQSLGFTYNAMTGDMTTTEGKQVLNLDRTGSMKDLIEGVLVEIANWPKDAIEIRKLPSRFIESISKLLEKNETELQEDYKKVIDTLVNLFSVDTSQLVSVGGIGPGGKASPRSGNVPPEEVASLLIDTGLSKDLVVRLTAIAGRESGYISDNINFNGGGDGSSEDGSYDFGLFQFNTVHAEGATNSGRGLSGPAKGASLAELKAAVAQNPQWVKDFYKKMSDPKLAAAKAARFATQDPDLSAWHSVSSITAEDLAAASAAVDKAYQMRGKGPGAPPIDDIPERPDESNKPKGNMTYTFQLNHQTGGFTELMGAKDFMTPIDTKVLAVEDGRIDSQQTSADQGGAFFFIGKSGQRYWYGHLKVKAPPGNYKAGAVIGTVGPHSNGSHLHLAVAGRSKGTGVDYQSTDGDVVVVEHPPLENLKSNSGELPNVGGDVVGGITVGGPDDAGSGQIGIGAIADIARQVAFFTFNTGVFENAASNILTGKRSLANDVSLMTWMSDIVKSSGRVFCSTPNGDFLAFFPDYYGYYGTLGGGQSATWFLSEIEIIDLTIDNSDVDLTTHVFGVSPVVVNSSAAMSNASTLNLLYSTYATVEEPAFTWFMAVNEGEFEPNEFLKLYGARPYKFDMPFISQRELVWMATWMEFAKLWSKRFASSAQFTFMPEIQPGWLLNIGNRLQMYVESVTHNFDYSGGFTTSAELSSAATLSEDIDWLPRVGDNNGVMDLTSAANIDSVGSSKTSTTTSPRRSGI